MSADIVTLDHPINAKLSHEIVDLTPALAEKWLGKNLDNRNIRPGKVRAYTRDMRNGKWSTTGEAIKFDWNGVLIDGQHRCQAVIDSGTTIRVLVVKGLAPDVRQVIDSGAPRSAADALRFAGHDTDPNISAALARIAIAREAGGLRNALAADMGSPTHQEILDWAVAHPVLPHAVSLARRTCRSIGIMPSVWAYCLYEFIQVDGTAAVEFATSTAEFRTNGKGDPRHALIDVFRLAEAGRRRKPSTAESIYIVFRAWNAWVGGKRLTQIIPLRGDGVGHDIPKIASTSAVSA